MVVLLVVGLIVGGIAVMALYIRATGEAHDARSLDDARIREAAATGCSGITQALNGAGADRQERIVAGNVAIDELVRGIEELDRSVLADDEPALDWVADWERLATEREAFGERLAGNSAARFKIPETDDGYPITQRLIDVAPPECERAVTLASQP